MKRLYLILLFSVLASCGETYREQIKRNPPKFKDGQVVYVVGEAFVVHYYRGDGQYWLDKLDCRGSGASCSLAVNESDISATKK